MKPQKFFWILMSALVVLIVAGGTGYYMAVKYVANASSKLREQYNAQQQADAKLEQIAKLRAQYNHDVVPIQASIDSALPRSKNQTQILTQLESLTQSAGLQLSTVSFPNSTGPSATSQAIKNGLVLALPISFQTTGTYAQLQAFLTNIENLNRYTSITNLAVSKADSKKISFSINMNAYFKP